MKNFDQDEWEIAKRQALDDGGLAAVIVDATPDDGLMLVHLQIYFGAFPIADMIVPDAALPVGAHIGDELLIEMTIRTCRKCGCTGGRACVTGCEWIEADLCSNCGAVILDASGRPVG